jgi:hypothetical protein
MHIEIPGSRNVLFRMLLSALSNAIIYFLAIVTGITCFMMGCYSCAILLLGMIGLRIYLDIRAVREVNQINQAFQNLMDAAQNVNFNTVVP